MIENTADLRALLDARQILLAPGIYDALTALIAEQAGARALYLSGASLAYTRLGRPDIGLVTMNEVAETIAAIRDRVELPLIVDADTGFGNALNIQRTFRSFERMGANAVQLEDQTNPKRCGHLDGKTLISGSEMCGKIKAAVDARENAQTLLIARTDAIAVEGLDPALERAHTYREAGADVLFVEAPQSRQQIQRIVSALGDGTPLMANMVEGGKTPASNACDLEALGFALVIFPGGLVRMLAKASREYFDSLLTNGSNELFQERMHDFSGLNNVIGTSQLVAAGKRYDREFQ